MIKNLKLKIKNYPRGFTLVELMIVIAIMAILIVSMVSIFNATGIYNKARDAQRKKDLGRIKVAFEEYFNDKGCYPDETVIANLNLVSNCNKSIFSPWLSNWPCDPNKQPYKIVVEDKDFSTCSKWYKVFANLENKKDSSIPVGWDSQNQIVLGTGINSKMVNYGISSPNVNWYSTYMNPECSKRGRCMYITFDDPPVCNVRGTGCVGPNCYIGACQPDCQVACCGRVCP